MSVNKLFLEVETFGEDILVLKIPHPAHAGPAIRPVLQVKSKCLPVLRKFNFSWPAALDCSRLPTPENNGLCMEVPNFSSEATPPPTSRRPKMTYAPPINRDGHAKPASAACPPRQTWVATRHGGSCTAKCGYDVLFRREDKHFAEVSPWPLIPPLK
ncbi:frizzled-9-like [Penaeus japonicus]|uniref:frizzled-9-like n=1 Tax=Penaeus japonicus TaxID=27405 RepID=UPI001C71471D|nr:frizzled-9-like [Penaeus japonicus]